MSANGELPDAEMVEEPAAPPDPGTLRGLIEIPGIRNYLFTGLAALAMIFMIMLGQSSDIGGLLLVILGAAGMIFRWPAMPTFFLLVLLWFLIFPFGIPPAYENSQELSRGHFRVADVLLAFSVVVYLAAHYRIYVLTAQALPSEGRQGRKKPKPISSAGRQSMPRRGSQNLRLAGASCATTKSALTANYSVSLTRRRRS